MNPLVPIGAVTAAAGLLLGPLWAIPGVLLAVYGLAKPNDAEGAVPPPEDPVPGSSDAVEAALAQAEQAADVNAEVEAQGIRLGEQSERVRRLQARMNGITQELFRLSQIGAIAPRAGPQPLPEDGYADGATMDLVRRFQTRLIELSMIPAMGLSGGIATNLRAERTLKVAGPATMQVLDAVSIPTWFAIAQAQSRPVGAPANPGYRPNVPNRGESSPRTTSNR